MIKKIRNKVFVLNHNIEIGEYNFKRVVKVEINKSKELLQDTCIIKVPSTAILKDNSNNTAVEISKIIEVGNKVKIDLGYNKNLRNEFIGVVTGFNYNQPLEIRCEDNTYYFKKAIFKEKKEYKGKILIKNILNDILKEVEKDFKVIVSDSVKNISYMNFVIAKGVNVYSIFHKIKDDFNFNIYLKDESTLYVGLSNEDEGKKVIYHLQKNVAKSNLEYKREEDVKIKLKCIALDKKNKQIHEYIPSKEDEGAERPFIIPSLYNDLSKEEKVARKDLITIGNQKIKEIKYTGYRGNMTVFLEPFCRPNNIVELRDDKYKEREGNFWVKSVKTTYGTNGARRIVELGIKVS